VRRADALDVRALPSAAARVRPPGRSTSTHERSDPRRLYVECAVRTAFAEVAARRKDMPRKQRFKPSRKPKPIVDGNSDQQRSSSGDDRMIGATERDREKSGSDRKSDDGHRE